MRSLSFSSLLGSFAALASTLALVGCNPSQDGATCGAGTTLVGNVCTPIPDTGVDAPPTAPTFAGLVAVAPVSTSSLLLVWAPATDAVTPKERLVYRVYAGTTPSGENFSTPIATSAPGASKVQVTGLSPTDTTYLVVRAVNEAGAEDTNTIEKSGKPAGDTQPPIFGGATAAAPDVGGAVKVSWDPPATDDLTPKEAITYLVYWSDKAAPDSFPSTPQVVTDPGATSAVVKGLATPKGTYDFIVRARDAAGNVEKNTKVVSSSPGPDTVPPTFSGCKAVIDKGADSLTVSWDAATDDVSPASAITYELFASTTPDGQDFSKPGGTVTGATSGKVSGLANGTTYYVVCRAKDASGNEEKNTSQVSDTTLKDSAPPTFAGLDAVTAVNSTGVTLKWTEATDDIGTPADITYDVFEALAPGDESFTAPPKYTVKGAGQFVVTGLKSATNYCWVVRAKDAAGLEETNKVEKCATTNVGFVDVQAIMTTHCAKSSCHTGLSPAAGMSLAAGSTYDNVVNVDSNEDKPLKRVQPSNPETSYLYLKITGRPVSGTDPMPPPTTGDFLTTAEKDTIKAWITQGAPKD